MAEYKKAIGEPHGLAELSIFYCEEAFRFVESCSWDDERYFDALIRMYAREPFCVLLRSAAGRPDTHRTGVDAHKTPLNVCEPLWAKCTATVFAVLRPQ